MNMHRVLAVLARYGFPRWTRFASLYFVSTRLDTVFSHVREILLYTIRRRNSENQAFRGFSLRAKTIRASSLYARGVNYETLFSSLLRSSQKQLTPTEVRGAAAFFDTRIVDRATIAFSLRHPVLDVVVVYWPLIAPARDVWRKL